MFDFDRLRDLAKRQGVTVTHLCDIVGKKNSYIADSKNKGIAIPLATIEIWAAALHTTPAYLMGETDDPGEGIKKEPSGPAAKELSEEDRAFIAAFRAASPEKRRAILELLK